MAASSCPLIGLFLHVIEIVMVNLFVACVVCFHCQILFCHSLTAGLHLVMVLICCVRLIVALQLHVTGAFPSQFLLASEQNGGLERESREGTRVGG